MGETLDLVERDSELTVQRAGLFQRQRSGQVPEQLMKLPHDHEHLEHPFRGFRDPPPVSSAESDLGDLLPRAEAVVHRAAREASLPESRVHAAAEVRPQIGTSLSGVFVDREIRRYRERWRDTAEPEAPLAVGAQIEPLPVGYIACGLTCLGQCVPSRIQSIAT